MQRMIADGTEGFDLAAGFATKGINLDPEKFTLVPDFSFLGGRPANIFSARGPNLRGVW